MANNIALFMILGSVIALLLYVPIFKPWFGFRKPKNHPGKWGQ